MRRGQALAAALAAVVVAAAAGAAGAAPQPAHAEPYMSVSADDEAFDRTFAGSMVVEVVVRDPDIRSTGKPAGEPSVTVDGEPLRMVQGTDGSWYAYFADIGAAMAADGAAREAGRGMDFGVFCAPSTAEQVLGASFADADGVAVARAVGGGTQGGAVQPGECDGQAGGELLNGVVRRAPRVSNAGGGGGGGEVPPGQIGIDPGAWPVVQLYSLSGSVDVEYERAGGAERAELEYDEIPNAAMSLDREKYPAGAEVYVTISDAQLNQDPTDRDVWTFSTDPGSPAVFYMGGEISGGMPAAAADLYPHLRAIGFEDNGALTIDAGRTVSFKPNGLQPGASINALGGGGGERSSLVTVRETRSSSSEFVSYDGDGESTVWVPRDAPRGTAATFEYNDGRVSALTGPSTASVGIGDAGGPGGRPAPGTRVAVTISDADRDTNPAKRDVLSASDAEPVPSVRMGSPLTLAGAGGAWWRTAGGDPVQADHSAIDSDRIAVSRPGGAGAATLIIDAGYGAGEVRDLQGGPSARSTAWINYDVRSLAGPGGQAGATIGIAFGGAGAAGAAVAPAEVWDASAGRGTVQVTGEHGNGRGEAVFVVDLPAGAAGAAAGGGGGSGEAAAVHIDLFSFGVHGDGRGLINNAVYRLELEETGAGSGSFEGTVEYVVMDERNGDDPALAASLVAYGDDVRIAVPGGGGRDDNGGVTISYRDAGGGGADEQVAAKAEVPSRAGSVHLGAASYGFGRPVTITVVDADLNTDHDRVEAYHVVGDPSSPHADTVAAGGAPLLEVTIKGERYRGCTVNGVEHGGLAASGFSLVETGPATGVFEGTFKMPSWICSADGSRLISPAGGKVDARYYDYADEYGKPAIVGAAPRKAAPGAGAAQGGPASGAAAAPGAGAAQGGPAAAADATQGGGLRIPADSRQVAMLRGEQMSDAELLVVVRGVVSAGAVKGLSLPEPAAGSAGAPVRVPSWFKTTAAWWGDGRVSDLEFSHAVRYVLDAGIVSFPK